MKTIGWEIGEEVQCREYDIRMGQIIEVGPDYVVIEEWFAQPFAGWGPDGSSAQIRIEGEDVELIGSYDGAPDGY